LDRIYLPPELRDGDRFVVVGAERRHLAVLRVHAGERFLATDGCGRELLLEVEETSRSELIARIVEESLLPAGPGRAVTLAVAPPKGARMDVAVEKATECGVGKIVPLLVERSVVRGRDTSERVARWRRIACSATAQSGRTRVPEVAAFTTLDAILAANEAGHVLLAHPPPGSRPVPIALAGARPGDLVTILVGPEGGFTEEETEIARHRGAITVSLGPNRLRTETAAVVSVALTVATLEAAEWRKEG
jgi:16S rRNA (uracil1498-N3)-methyltransferase